MVRGFQGLELKDKLTEDPFPQTDQSERVLPAGQVGWVERWPGLV